MRNLCKWGSLWIVILGLSACAAVSTPATLTLLPPTPTRPSPTTAPSSTPSPVPATPVPTPTLTPTLPFTSSQLAIEANCLVYNNAGTKQPEDVVCGKGYEMLSAFLASSDARNIALYYRSKVDAAENTLWWLDAVTQQMMVVYRGPSDLLAMSLSPNGQHLAYSVRGTQPSSGHGGGSSLVHWALGGGANYGVVYLAHADTPDKPQEVGFCGDDPAKPPRLGEKTCIGHLLWAPDSRSVAWADIRGLWAADMGYGIGLMREMRG